MRLAMVSSALIVLALGLSSAARASDTPNLAAGARYEISPNATYPYTMDGRELTKLTDGVLASSLIPTSFWKSKDAVGWRLPGSVKVKVDLGKVCSIDRVALHSCRGSEAQVNYPERVDVLVSEDGQDFHPMGDIFHNHPPDAGPYQVQWFSMDFASPTRARYVCFLIKPNGFFLFLDEIQVNGSEGAQGRARALAHDSLSVPMSGIDDWFQNKTRLEHTRRATLEELQDLPQPWIDSQLKAWNGQNGLPKNADELAAPSYGWSPAGLQGLEDRLALAWRNEHRNGLSTPLHVSSGDPWGRIRPMGPAALSANVSGLHAEIPVRGSQSRLLYLTNTGSTPLKVRATWEGKDGGPSLELRQVKFVTSIKDQLVPDALPRFAAMGLDLRPGETKPLWISIQAHDSRPGSYGGGLRITFGGQSGQTIPVQIVVNAVALPETQQTVVNAWGYFIQRLVRGHEDQAAADLIAHRVNIYPVPSGYLPWPKDGHAAWSNFAPVLKYQSSFQYIYLFLNLNAQMQKSFISPGQSPDAWGEGFKSWLREFLAYCEKNGIPRSKLIFHPLDEPSHQAIPDVVTVNRLIKEVDASLTTMETVTAYLQDSDLRAMQPVVDAFQIRLDEYKAKGQDPTPSVMPRKFWMYFTTGGKEADPLTDYRGQCWEAFRRGATGVGFWAYGDIGSVGSAWDDFSSGWKAFAVVYDSPDEMVPSRRWEAWREGVEDLELMQLAAKKHGRPAVLAALASFYSGKQDAAAIQTMRTQLYHMIQD